MPREVKTEKQTCPKCIGWGTVFIQSCMGQTKTRCPACGGKGHRWVPVDPVDWDTGAYQVGHRPNFSIIIGNPLKEPDWNVIEDVFRKGLYRQSSWTAVWIEGLKEFYRQIQGHKAVKDYHEIARELVQLRDDDDVGDPHSDCGCEACMTALDVRHIERIAVALREAEEAGFRRGIAVNLQKTHEK